ncbi:TPA: hypothetical protein ACH0SE_004246 [Providencia rettgeri]
MIDGRFDAEILRLAIMGTPFSLEYHHYQRQLMVVNCTGLAYQPKRLLAHLSMPPYSPP